jgi:putative tryptophan/tyrosine transport system substrate-binding protein
MSLQLSDATTKRIELLREVVRGLRRLAVMTNVANPTGAVEMREVRAAAGALGLEIIASEIKGPEDIVPAFEALRSRADALYVVTDPLMNTDRVRVSSFALSAGLPSVCGFREFVDAGGFISYGAYYPALFRRTAEMVDKILHGAKPAEIPVEQPTKFELVINLKTAKALGLTIPETLLATADEVIQ